MLFIKNINFKSLLGILLLAFSISPLSFWLMQGLGANVIEPWMLLGGLLLFSGDKYYKIKFQKIIHNSQFRILFFFYTIMLILGYIMTDDFKSAYADYRVVVLLTIAYCMFKDVGLLNYKEGQLIKILLWFVIFFDLIYSRIFLYEYDSGITDSVKMRMISPIIIVVLMVLYLYKWKSPLKAFILLLVVVYFMVFGAMRNFFVIAFVSMLLFVLGIAGKKIKWYMKILLVIAIVALPVLLADSIVDYWMSDTSRSIHTMQRTEQLVSGEDDEVSRINSFVYPIIYFPYYLFPHGIGWRGFLGHYDHSDVYWFASADSTFYYVAFHYSIIALIVYLRFLFKKFFHILLGKNLLTYREIFMFSLLAILFFSAFFTQGTMMMQVEFGFAYGALLALFTNARWLYSGNIKN